MKTWEETIEEAAVFINFLKQGHLFSQPYQPKTVNHYRVISDIQLAVEIVTDVIDDGFSDRETVFESNFPESFVWVLGRISNQLIKSNLII